MTETEFVYLLGAVSGVVFAWMFYNTLRVVGAVEAWFNTE